MPESSESLVAPGAAEFTGARRTRNPSDNHLLAHTRHWLGSMPRGVRPVHLGLKPPRWITTSKSLISARGRIAPVFILSSRRSCSRCTSSR